MRKNSALTLAGIVFALVSFFHLLRLYLALEITIGPYIIPLWVSWVGFLISIILCILMFTACKSDA